MIDYIGETWPDAKTVGWDGPGYYFWDETLTECFGPYPSALKAHEEQWRYCKEVLGMGVEDDKDVL